MTFKNSHINITAEYQLDLTILREFMSVTKNLLHSIATIEYKLFKPNAAL